MLRLTLFATVCAVGAAVATPPPVIGLRAGEDITHLLDRTIDEVPLSEVYGEGGRRKSLDPGMVSIAARVLCGEVARQGDREVRAVVGVVLNRLQRAPDRTLADVVLRSNSRGVFAFTAADPVRANGELVWGKAVAGSRCHRRMARIVNEEWQDGNYLTHKHEYYYHPRAMQPKNAVPWWAVGARFTEIGHARFYTEAEIQRAADARNRRREAAL